MDYYKERVNHILSNGYKLPIKDVLTEAWDLLNKKLLLFVAYTFLFHILFLGLGVLHLPGTGLIRIALGYFLSAGLFVFCYRLSKLETSVKFEDFLPPQVVLGAILVSSILYVILFRSVSFALEEANIFIREYLSEQMPNPEFSIEIILGISWLILSKMLFISWFSFFFLNLPIIVTYRINSFIAVYDSILISIVRYSSIALLLFIAYSPILFAQILKEIYSIFGVSTGENFISSPSHPRIILTYFNTLVAVLLFPYILCVKYVIFDRIFGISNEKKDEIDLIGD